MYVNSTVTVPTALPNSAGPTVPPEGYASFYRLNYRRLMACALHVGASHTEADEVVQETLIAMLDRWENIANPSAYARLAIVRNLIKLRRSASRRAVHEEQYAAKNFERCTDELFDDNRNGNAAVDAMLDLLTPTQRQVAAYLLDGCSRQDIALLLGSSDAMIRRTVSNIRRRLEPVRRARAGRPTSARPAMLRGRKVESND